MALVLASIWNVLTQSLGYIPAFGLREPTFGYYARVLKDPGFLSSVLVSLKISVWSAVISTVCPAFTLPTSSSSTDMDRVMADRS